MPPRDRKPSTRAITIDSTAQAYLELLHDRGIEYFFGKGGTDFAPLVEAFAKSASQGGTTPKPMTVPHEYVAVSMPDGFYRVTGRPQAVMVHVIVSTANAAGAIRNAARAHVPILFSAGRTPITESGLSGARNAHIHWAQESFDHGSLVREFVKWDYELRNFSQVETVVDRALEIAMAEPRGPVYLTLPRKVLAEEHTEYSYTSPSRHSTASPPYPAPERIKEAAQALARVKFPLNVTQRVGAHPSTEQSLVKLAESLAIPVVSPAGMYMNSPSDHPLHLGYVSEPLVQEADVILVIDADMKVQLTLPGSYYAASPAAGLGWGTGAALGVKLAAPEKTVIATLGEGAYMFGCPTAAHFVSRAYQLPVLFVIFNNQCWNAVKRATKGVYPNGWAAKTDTWPLTDLMPSPSFERMADVHGAYGEIVEDPAEFMPALRRGLKAVRQKKRQAILNIVCKHP